MKTTQKFYLVCGVLAPLIYVSSDIIASNLWQNYSYTAQSVSELRALGAPTRPFLIPILTIYAMLEIAFGIGVWKANDQKRTLRITGVLLICLGVVDLAAPLFPMNLRENLSETGRSLTDTLHIIITAVTVLLIFLVIGFGAQTYKRWFRIYSYLTIIILFLCGVWASLDVSRMEANLPTPWIGVKERINIYGYMLWLAVFANVLFWIEKKAKSSDRVQVH
jgi:amino acid transporter